MTQSFTNRRLQIFEDRLNKLYEELETVYAQIGRTLDDITILRLKRQIDHLEQEIEDLEQKILQIEQKNPEIKKEESIQVANHKLVINLTLIFVKRFNLEELRMFCFQLNVEYDDLSAEGKTGKARELAKYLNRYNRIKESIELGKSLRPDIDWDKVVSG